MSAMQESVPSVGLVVQTVDGIAVGSDSIMNSGVNSAAMIVAPSHGSMFSFLAALYATMIGRK